MIALPPLLVSGRAYAGPTDAEADSGPEVDSGNGLTQVESVSGQILDADCSRLLVLDPNGTTVEIYDRATQQYTVIASNLPLTKTYGLTANALTPVGALLGLYNPLFYNNPYSALLEWRSNQLSLLDQPNSGVSVAVAGNYAIWNDGSGASLVLRDLTSGTNTMVSSSAGNWRNGVASNGDVAFWTGGGSICQVNRWRNGTTTQLTSDSYCNAYPVTDGVNVVYEKGSAPTNNPPHSIAVYGSNGEVLLDAWDVAREDPWPGRDYEVSGGWTAYNASSQGAVQIFVYDPTGTTHQLTQFGPDPTFGSDPIIDAMDPHGGVMLLFGGRRYFASPSVPPVDVGSSDGKAIFFGGTWYLMNGSSLFSVSTGVDGGVSDGGTCEPPGQFDAGPDAQGVGDAAESDASSNDATVADGGTTSDGGSILDASEDVTVPDAGEESDSGIAEGGGASGDDGGASGPPTVASSVRGGCTVGRSAGVTGTDWLLVLGMPAIVAMRLRRRRSAADPGSPWTPLGKGRERSPDVAAESQR
jgi:hypothetical protein